MNKEIMSDDFANGKVIEIYSTPFSGHAIPLCRIAKMLMKNTKYKVYFLTSKFLAVKMKKLFPDISMIEIQDGIDEETVHQNAWKLTPYNYVYDFLLNLWNKYFEKKDQKADLVISDFMMAKVMRYCRTNKIKLIVNFPDSLQFLKGWNMPHFSRSFGVGGFTIVHPQILNPTPFLKWSQIFEQFKDIGLVFVNSFIGFDKPAILPTHYVLTGFIAQKEDANQQLGSDLTGWINFHKSKGKNKFIYIAFGTIVNLSQSFARLLYQTLKKMDYPVIWSLKNSFGKSFDNQNFFVREWLPQPAILGLEEVKIFVSHAGYGSLCQCIRFGKPTVMIPVFSDQPYHADMMEMHGAGISVWKTYIPLFRKQFNPSVEPKKIIEAIEEMMANDQYQKSIEKMSALCQSVDTEQIICKAVDTTLNVGYQHLIDPAFNQMTKRSVKDTLILVCFVLVLLLLKSWFF